MKFEEKYISGNEWTHAKSVKEIKIFVFFFYFSILWGIAKFFGRGAQVLCNARTCSGRFTLFLDISSFQDLHKRIITKNFSSRSASIAASKVKFFKIFIVLNNLYLFYFGWGRGH